MNRLSEIELQTLAKDLSSPASDGYLQMPLPCALDDRVGVLAKVFVAADPPEKRRIMDIFGLEQAFALLTFAERMAILGLRSGSHNPLVKGLAALAIEGFRMDSRESLPILSLLNRSAEKNGIDTAVLLEDAARYSLAETAEQFRAFAQRTPRDKTIEAMGYSHQVTAEGPTYVRKW
jgi:hypothetical protein